MPVPLAGGDASEAEDENAPHLGNKNRVPTRVAASGVTAAATRKTAATANKTVMMDLTGDEDDMHPPTKAPTTRGGRGGARGRGSRDGRWQQSRNAY